jgi:hypothetical protein
MSRVLSRFARLLNESRVQEAQRAASRLCSHESSCLQDSKGQKQSDLDGLDNFVERTGQHALIDLAAELHGRDDVALPGVG